MSHPRDTDSPAHEGAVAHHRPDDHGEDHGHDDHAHPDEALGPIDVAAWGAGVLGVAVSVVIAACQIGRASCRERV